MNPSQQCALHTRPRRRHPAVRGSDNRNSSCVSHRTLATNFVVSPVAVPSTPAALPPRNRQDFATLPCVQKSLRGILACSPLLHRRRIATQHFHSQLSEDTARPPERSAGLRSTLTLDATITATPLDSFLRASAHLRLAQVPDPSPSSYSRPEPRQTLAAPQICVPPLNRLAIANVCPHSSRQLQGHSSQPDPHTHFCDGAPRCPRRVRPGKERASLLYAPYVAAHPRLCPRLELAYAQMLMRPRPAPQFPADSLIAPPTPQQRRNFRQHPHRTVPLPRLPLSSRRRHSFGETATSPHSTSHLYALSFVVLSHPRTDPTPRRAARHTALVQLPSSSRRRHTFAETTTSPHRTSHLYPLSFVVLSHPPADPTPRRAARHTAYVQLPSSSHHPHTFAETATSPHRTSHLYPLFFVVRSHPPVNPTPRRAARHTAFVQLPSSLHRRQTFAETAPSPRCTSHSNPGSNARVSVRAVRNREARSLRIKSP